MAPSLAAPLLIDASRSTVGSGTREDIVAVPDVIWVSEGHEAVKDVVWNTKMMFDAMLAVEFCRLFGTVVAFTHMV